MSTYVGLTPAAKAWLKRYGIDMEKGNHDKGVRIDRYVMSETEEGKPIYGHLFHLPPLEGQKRRVALELKQVKVNGMICSDLYISMIDDKGNESAVPHCCSWVKDISLKEDGVLVHYDSGRYCNV